MDWSDPQVTRFAQSLSAMDDEALVSLANKGFLRRAQKDLESRKPELAGADEGSVSLILEGQTIRLVQPANKSTCTCASGICRHILASIIFLRDMARAAAPAPAAGTGEGAVAIEPPPPAVDPGQWMIDLDEAAIQKWAGKPLLKRAVVCAAHGYSIETSPASIAVRLPAQNIIVRCMPGGLDAMLCSCHAAGPCEHKVAAIMAVRSHRAGKAIEIPGGMLEASSGAPRSRGEVRGCVAELLGEMIGMGLSQLSQASSQRLATLATSAHGVDLPRLSRMLKSLADEVSLTLKRDASASSDALLVSCARVAALCEALERPTAALVGEHRSVYMPVAGSIELVGLGARRWRTRSGYHGMTVYFWEASGQRWSSWNDARPIAAPGFDPVVRFDESGPWSGCACPRQAANSRWRLSGAHRNSAGRITSRDNTRGIPAGNTRPEDGPLVRDFSRIPAIAQEAFAPGLGDRRSHADLILLAPAAWGEAEYDAVRQEVRRDVMDDQGRAVRLVLSHSPETDQALTTLQKVEGGAVQAVLGSLRIGHQGLFVEPITLWTATGPVHLTLEGLSRKKAAAPPPAAADEEEEQEEETEEEAPLVEATAVGRALARIERELVGIAESGIGVMRDLSPLKQAAAELAGVGMASISGLLLRLAEELEQYRNRLDRDPAGAARRVLQCAYAVHVAGACQTLALISVGE